jgi:putative membrane protein
VVAWIEIHSFAPEKRAAGDAVTTVSLSLLAVSYRDTFMTAFFLRAAFAALGLWLAARLLPGLSFATANTLLGAALLLGIVNAVVRPLAVILTLPLTLITLGFFLLVINAAMLGLVAWLLPGFQIIGFWTAVGASLIVSIISWLASSLTGGNGKIQITTFRR